MPVRILEGGCSRASLTTYVFKLTSNLQPKFIIGQFLYSIHVLPLPFPLNSSSIFLFSAPPAPPTPHLQKVTSAIHFTD